MSIKAGLYAARFMSHVLSACWFNARAVFCAMPSLVLAYACAPYDNNVHRRDLYM